MSIAFTQLPTSFLTLRRDTMAHLLSDLDDALFSVNWAKDRSLANGAVWILTSPQGYISRCRIQDTGRSGHGVSGIDVQFMNDDEDKLGFNHLLSYGDIALVPEYQINAGKCQMFVSASGQNSDGAFPNEELRFTTVCGGIPFVPDVVDVDCDVPGAAPVSEIWWSSGNISGGCQNFRNSRYCTHGYSTYKNGSVFVSAAYESYADSPLQLFPQTPTFNVDQMFSSPARTVRYVTAEPFLFDSLLGFRWGMFGQIWDSLMKSRDVALETEFTTYEPDDEAGTKECVWRAHNYGIGSHIGGLGSGTYFATLFLLKDFTPPTTGGNSNYAY